MPALPISIADHVDRAKDRLTSPLCGPNMQTLVGLLAERWQLLEDVTCQLIVERALDVAEGVNLDQYGALVGEPRSGLTDADYRRIIQARILSNLSEGTTEEILTIVGLLTGSTEIQIQPAYPAGYILSYVVTAALDPALQRRIADQVVEITGAGIGLDGIVEACAPYFGFLGNPNALGFEQGKFADRIDNN